MRWNVIFSLPCRASSSKQGFSRQDRQFTLVWYFKANWGQCTQACVGGQNLTNSTLCGFQQDRSYQQDKSKKSTRGLLYPSCAQRTSLMRHEAVYTLVNIDDKCCGWMETWFRSTLIVGYLPSAGFQTVWILVKQSIETVGFWKFEEQPLWRIRFNSAPLHSLHSVMVGRETMDEFGTPLQLSHSIYSFINTIIEQSPSPNSSNGPPMTFHDILPAELITTSTRSEAGYMGYRKSRFKTFRRSTEPARTPISLANLNSKTPGREPLVVPARSSTIRKMKGVLHSIRRTMTKTSSKGSKRPPLPTSSSFAAINRSSRFVAGRWTSRGDDIRFEGYQNLADSDSGLRQDDD